MGASILTVRKKGRRVDNCFQRGQRGKDAKSIPRYLPLFLYYKTGPGFYQFRYMVDNIGWRLSREFKLSFE
jgi:hypothetical protein